MGGFGDRLKQAREARGETLEHVAKATRIQLRHLEALERGDLHALPAAPFAKGYIKAYAQHIGVEAEPFLEAYRSELQRQGRDTGEVRDKMIEAMSHIVAQRARGAERRAWSSARAMVVTLGLAVLVLAAVAGWLLSRAGPPPAASLVPASPPSAAPNPSPAVPASPDAAPTVAATPPVRPRLTRAVSSAALHVSDSGIGAGISNHRLVGRADRFAEGTEVAFWTRVTGGEAGDVIRHVWFHRGQAVMRADLEIGGPHWRTYSRRVLPQGATGDWAVEARAADGRLLARQEFVCGPDEQ